MWKQNRKSIPPFTWFYFNCRTSISITSLPFTIKINSMYNVKYHPEDIYNSRFLVTGGAGFIGSNIVEYLMQHGAGKVRVLDNFSTGSINNIKDF